ncbi:MAG: GTP 3',8-cyclase MoaA [Desulfobacterales bacterium]|nr:GTP 3',8-cyclase MoaA [Desulfobacterales bacterium]
MFPDRILKLSDVKLIDPCNRHLNYLRISITDRCNLNCIYCVPGERVPRISHDEILTYEEILRLVRIAAGLGITKIRVTGGEPLVRKGVFGFLNELSRIDALSDLSLTTNGVALKDNLAKIRSAGIKRINISLDTLQPSKFQRITGFDLFDQVWQGIEMALEMGFHPIKLNIVALNGINDDELTEMARLSFDFPFHIRFIEYMPIGESQVGSGPPLLAPEIKRRISELGHLIPIRSSANDGPAQRYRFEGAAGEVGFIHALSHHFCDRCNRLRLTARGQLRPCLLSDHHEDVKGPMRSGYSDEKLARIFFKAVRHKPSDHNLAVRDPSRVCGQMRSIGG